MATETLTVPPKKKRRELSTGQQIDPVKRERVLKLLALGRPKSEIKKSLKIDHYSIAALEGQYLPDIALKREHAAAKAYAALTASLESAHDRAAKGLAGALDAKLLSETWLTLSGEASSITEVNHVFPGLDEFSPEPPIRDVAAIVQD